MMKFSEGVGAFETTNVDEHPLNDKAAITHHVVYRVSDGVWVHDKKHYSSHTLTKMTPTEAAVLFTKHGTDMPPSLVAEIARANND